MEVQGNRLVDERFTLSAVEDLCLAQVGGCKNGLSGVLWIAQVGVLRIGVCVNLLNG